MGLTAGQQTDIGTEEIANFIRGDRSNEAPTSLGLRKRESAVGDILHSNIAYWNDGTNKTLYVGGNDGMLHAFDAETGAKRFAYIPSMLMPNLKRLSIQPYSHTPFVGGPITITKFNISDTNKTILVGALGAGGAGLYALDITSATAADEDAVASKILWEITPNSTGFSGLGHTYSTPVLTKLNDGTPVVIIGNGYANTTNGDAILYIINAVTGALIEAFDTGEGSSTSPNGLSSPTIFDTNGDHRPEFVYAGDIDGNMWEFNLTANSYKIKELFTTNPVQPITTAPGVSTHPKGGQMVAFATGNLLNTGEQSNCRYSLCLWYLE